MKYVETYDDLIKMLIEFDSNKYETIFLDDISIYVNSTENLTIYKKVIKYLKQLNLILLLVSRL